MTMPESLQVTLGRAASSRSSGGPGLQGLADHGLGDVVDHEGQLREVADGLDRGGEVRGLGEQVVGQAGVGDGGQAALDVGAEEPVDVRLVVDLVADRLQIGAVRARAQAVQRGRRRRPR